MLNINILHIYIKHILYLYVSDSFSTIDLEVGSFIHVLHCLFLINQVTSYVWFCLCCILGHGESLLRASFFQRTDLTVEPAPFLGRGDWTFQPWLKHVFPFPLIFSSCAQMTHLTCSECWYSEEVIR